MQKVSRTLLPRPLPGSIGTGLTGFPGETEKFLALGERSHRQGSPAKARRLSRYIARRRASVCHLPIPHNTSESALAHSEDEGGALLKVYRGMGLRDFLTINRHGLLLDQSARLTG